MHYNMEDISLYVKANSLIEDEEDGSNVHSRLSSLQIKEYNNEDDRWKLCHQYGTNEWNILIGTVIQELK